MLKSALVVCAVACGFMTATHVQAQSIGRHGGWVIVTPVDPTNTSVNLIERPTVYPDVTVNRGLDQTPVRPYMAEVQVVTVTTLVDPLADYASSTTSYLDENHWIRRAQREYLAAHTDTSAYVIVGSPHNPTIEHLTPHMIFLKPNGTSAPPSSTTRPRRSPTHRWKTPSRPRW